MSRRLDLLTVYGLAFLVFLYAPVLLLPLFFAYTGLRTDIAAIQGWTGLVTLLLILAVAFVSKLGGAYAAARLVGEGSGARSRSVSA